MPTVDRGEDTCERVRALAGNSGPESATEIVRELDAEQREAFARAARCHIQSYAVHERERVILSIVERWPHVAWYWERPDGAAFESHTPRGRRWLLPLSEIGERVCDLLVSRGLP